MSKYYSDQIHGTTNKKGEPKRILRWDKWYRVEEIIERRREIGECWAGEHPKEYWRLQLEGDRTWEVVHDLKTHKWYMYRIYD